MKRALSALLALLLLPVCACADRLGAWLPYWDASAAIQEGQALDLDRAIAFAATFDEHGRPFLAEEAEDLLWDMQIAFAGTDTQVYLSVVNDQETRSGTVGKSNALLHQLLRSDKAMAQHIDDLIMLVDAARVEAVEIDYENLGSDEALWQRFTLFIEQLYQHLQRDGIALRVVLPWDTPRYATLPQGPEYTVMCYNLYGTHSGPGPKADIAFLAEIAALYADAPRPLRMAFATGGYDWSANGVESLTQQEAERRLALLQVTPTRDAASGALTATYTMDGISHTLWYADGETLRLWQECMAAFDGFDLFRLGGIRPTTLSPEVITP
ncbi:MAG: hypothetical protein J6M20_02035 [Clostridia bacterium]|nr:hypothetical protein [Clostridia bacterium]